MFNNDKMNYKNVLAMYVVLFVLTLSVDLIFYPDLRAFLTGNVVKYFSVVSALIGIMYCACSNQIKDILSVKLYDTAKYDKIYQDYKSHLKGSNESHFYMDKHGPLNHFIDLLRSCGGVLILVPILILVLNASGSSMLWASIGLICFVVSLQALIVIVYYSYKNIESLRRFSKD